MASRIGFVTIGHMSNFNLLPNLHYFQIEFQLTLKNITGHLQSSFRFSPKIRSRAKIVKRANSLQDEPPLPSYHTLHKFLFTDKHCLPKKVSFFFFTNHVNKKKEKNPCQQGDTTEQSTHTWSTSTNTNT